MDMKPAMPDHPARPLRLDYAQEEVRSTRVVLRAAGLCSAIPLAVGICDFLLWLPTRWEALEIAGLCVICIGTIFVAAGLVVVCVHWFFSRWRSNAPASWWPSRLEVLTVALLLSNFLFAAAIVVVIGNLRR